MTTAEMVEATGLALGAQPPTAVAPEANLRLPRRPAPFSIWRRMAQAEARQIEIDLNEAIEAGSPYPDTQGYEFNRLVSDIRLEVSESRAAADNPWPDGVLRRIGHICSEAARSWAGSESETAVAALHRAEGLLLMVLPDVAVRCEALTIESIFRENKDIALSDPRHDAFSGLFDRIDGTNPRSTPSRSRRARREDASTADSSQPAVAGGEPASDATCIELGDRVMLREVRRQQNESWEIARARLRIFRNILTATSPFLTLVLIAIAVIAWWDPSLITLQHEPSGIDVALVEGLGAFGGLLSAVASLQTLRNFQRFYGLPLAQIFLKLPAGAATALAGMILLQHGLLGITAVSWDLVVPYALAFGVAQIAVTKRIDSRASALLGDANAKSPSTTQTSKSSDAVGDIG